MDIGHIATLRARQMALYSISCGTCNVAVCEFVYVFLRALIGSSLDSISFELLD